MPAYVYVYVYLQYLGRQYKPVSVKNSLKYEKNTIVTSWIEEL